jgi:hypothetical protein
LVFQFLIYREIKMGRESWEFSTMTKEIAWRQAIQNGEIPEGADPRHYDFHHRYPVEVARAEGMDPNLVTSAVNCLVILRGAHRQLHRNNTNWELASQVDDLPDQPRLFEP